MALSISRWSMAAALVAVPVLLSAAGPYIFQETFDDGSLDGAALVSGDWAVANGAVHGSAASGRVDYLATSPFTGSDYEVSATVRLTGEWASAGVIARFVDRSNYYYAVLDTAAVGAGEPSRAVGLYKVSPNPTEADSLLSGGLYPGASYHLLGGAPFPTELNQTYEVSLSAAGDTLAVSVNGVTLFTVIDHDDALTNAGAAGLFSYQTAASFDNWRVQARKTNRK